MTKDLTKGSPIKLITLFAMTMLLSDLMTYVYSTTDTLMVGRFISPDALGAVSAAYPVVGLVDGFIAAMICGFAVIAGNAFGANETKKLKGIMANVVWLTAIMAGVATVLCIVFCKDIVVLMNTPEGFVDMANAYMLVMMSGMPVRCVVWVCSAMFMALGDSKTQLPISALCGFLNVAFNAFFLGLLDMGVEGAAYGTLCSNAVGALLYLFFLKKRMHVLLFKREDARLSAKTVKELLANGIPLGLMDCVITVGTMILQIAVNGHGEVVVNAMAVAGRVTVIYWMLFATFETALIYFCAQNLGAKRIDRIRTGVKQTTVICFGIGVACTLIAVFFGTFIYAWFVGDSPEIIAEAERFVFTQVFFFPFMVILSVLRAGMKGLGSTVVAVVCGSVELITRVVSAVFFADNLLVLYFAAPAAWVGTAVFLVILYPHTLKKREAEYARIEAAEESFVTETATEIVE